MLRIAKRSDAGAIAAIYRPYVETTAITFEEAPPSVEDIEAKIARIGSSFPFIVFDEGGEVLGYAYATRYRERAAYRWSLEDSVYVRGDSHGRGIGKALLSALVGILRELGYVKVYAVITPPNPSSFRLHERLGFESLGRFPDTAFKLGEWQAIDWMELTLRQPPASPGEPLPFLQFATERPQRLGELLASGGTPVSR